MTRDPVSWLLAEPGWPVYDADGKKLGKVDEVLGDEQTDIFHGLLVDGGPRGADPRGGDLAQLAPEVCIAPAAASREP